MAKYQLTNSEVEELFSQDPAEKDGGGFQSFFVNLQNQCNRTSGEIELGANDIARINKHIAEYKKGGWQNKLKRIFERSLLAAAN